MALIVNTNISSLNARRNLENNQSQLGGSISRISSGVRIDGASTGNAELALTENIKADIAAIRQGSRNLTDGKAFIKIAEGSLNEISGILLRLRSLASQSANGSIGETERATIDLEYQASIQEVDRIVKASEFNEISLLDGSLAASAAKADHIILQLGVDAKADNQIDLNSAINLTDVGTAALGLTGSNVKTPGAAFRALNDLASSISEVIEVRSRVGTVQVRMSHAYDNMKLQEENLTAAVSSIRDTDLAEELADLTKNQLLVQAGTAMVGQANINPQAALTLLNAVQ